MMMKTYFLRQIFLGGTLASHVLADGTLSPTPVPTSVVTSYSSGICTDNVSRKVIKGPIVEFHSPTETPTSTPTTSPTATPTGLPTKSPTATPTTVPTSGPTASPTVPPFIPDPYCPIGDAMVDDDSPLVSDVIGESGSCPYGSVLCGGTMPDGQIGDKLATTQDIKDAIDSGILTCQLQSTGEQVVFDVFGGIWKAGSSGEVTGIDMALANSSAPEYVMDVVVVVSGSSSSVYRFGMDDLAYRTTGGISGVFESEADTEISHLSLCMKKCPVDPTSSPTSGPTGSPTGSPTASPTASPTSSPSKAPTPSPTPFPTVSPTGSPTKAPTSSPTSSPTSKPSPQPTSSPTPDPTKEPTAAPTSKPTGSPTGEPTKEPTPSPTPFPTSAPTASPTGSPTKDPTKAPTSSPTDAPTGSPTASPTTSPTSSPTAAPTRSPTSSPTASPTRPPIGTQELEVLPDCPVGEAMRDIDSAIGQDVIGQWGSCPYGTVLCGMMVNGKLMNELAPETKDVEDAIASGKLTCYLHSTNEKIVFDVTDGVWKSESKREVIGIDMKLSGESTPGYYMDVLVVKSGDGSFLYRFGENKDEYDHVGGTGGRFVGSPAAAISHLSLCMKQCPSNEPIPESGAATSPTPSPTEKPTPSPTSSPTPLPTSPPTSSPTPAPTGAPTPEPTKAPTPVSTPEPTAAPTRDPTQAPTPDPTAAPTPGPTKAPTPVPTAAPTPDPTPAPTKSPTVAPIAVESAQESTLAPVAVDNTRELCIDCGDKSPLIEGNGKVTGGGWIYLTNYTYYDPDKVCNPQNTDECSTPYSQTKGPGMGPNPLNGIKANFGFNAMFRRGTPYGSTNFDFDGGHFHFHSTTQNTPYNFLEVVDEYHARWFGTGSLATTVNPKKSDYRPGFCFMVAVIDKGEPGDEDTWRLRIWQCKGSGTNDPVKWTKEDFALVGDNFENLVFDSNFVPPSHSEYNATKAEYPLPNTFEATDTARDRFHGTELGEVLALGGGNGGGNIQIHKKNKMSPNLNALLKNNGNCGCAKTPYEGDCSTGFVTGGGWILLDQKEVFLDGTDSSTLHGVKANFGFNAKAFHGQPTGSTNFDIEGKMFHFHSDNSGTEYDGLEVVCNSDKYGESAKTVYARWTGVGKVSRTADPDAGWQNGYRFYVTVQDNGEPGYQDTFRIKIYYPDNKTKLFDSYDVGTQGKPITVWDHDPECGNGMLCKGDWKADFSGNELGGLHETKKGGGNIQTHCKGGPNKCPNGMVSDYVLGSGAPAPTAPVPTSAPTSFTLSSSQGTVVSDTTNFVTIPNIESCSGSTCSVGNYNCGGVHCSYTKGQYVTLVDKAGHASSLYTELKIAGKTKLTVTYTYQTENFKSANAEFHVAYSYDQTAATAYFQNLATHGGSSTPVQITKDLTLDGRKDTMILRFTSDSTNNNDKVLLLIVTYKLE